MPLRTKGLAAGTQAPSPGTSNVGRTNETALQQTKKETACSKVKRVSLVVFAVLATLALAVLEPIAFVPFFITGLLAGAVNPNGIKKIDQKICELWKDYKLAFIAVGTVVGIFAFPIVVALGGFWSGSRISTFRN